MVVLIFSASVAKTDEFSLAFSCVPWGGGYHHSYVHDNPSILEVIINGQSCYQKQVAAHPFWNQIVKFPADVDKESEMTFRFYPRGLTRSPEVDTAAGVAIGDIQVRDSRGGEVRMNGEWTRKETSDGFLTQIWPGTGIAYHLALKLVVVAGGQCTAEDFCEYNWSGKLKRSPIWP